MAQSHSLPRRIDVHSHFLPPEYSEALANNGHKHPDGMPRIPPWSLEEHLEMMETANLSKAIISLSSPGSHLVPGNDELARRLSRHCNSYAAGLKSKYPDKFGFWASLPLPDVEGALEEIEKAVSEGADGFGFMTSYHGEYLGSAKFAPVFDALNKINAIVFIHPTKPCLKCPGLNASQDTIIDATPFGSQYPVPLFEFFFDTARAVIDLFASGTVARCPNIRFIIPHAGGCFPPLISRFIAFSNVVPGGVLMKDEDVRGALAKQFYWDLAGLVFAGEEGGLGQLKALKEGYDIGADRLFYGSDFPFTPTPWVKKFADRMKIGLEALFEQEEREAIYEGNIQRLLMGT